MSCTLKEEFLALHAGGDLPVAEAAEVEEHVLQCGSCAHELAAYRASRDVLLAARAPKSEGLGLWDEIEARLDVVDATTRHQRPWYAKYGFGAPLAAAAALVLTLQFLPNGGEVNPADGAGSGMVAQEGDPETDGLQRANNDDLAELLRYVPAQVDPAQTEGLVSQPVSSEEF